MKTANELETDVKWWEDEIRIREGKVEEAKRTRDQRKRELGEARREETQKKSTGSKKGSY